MWVGDGADSAIDAPDACALSPGSCSAGFGERGCGEVVEMSMDVSIAFFLVRVSKRSIL